MNPRTLWLLFALLCITLIAIPKLYADQVIAKCNGDECTISREYLGKLVFAVEYWYDKAKKCNAI